METRTILANALVVVARPVHRNHEKSSRSSSRASKSYKMSTYRLGSLGSTAACWCSARIMLEGRNRAAVHVIGGPRKLHTLARWSPLVIWQPGCARGRVFTRGRSTWPVSSSPLWQMWRPRCAPRGGFDSWASTFCSRSECTQVCAYARGTRATSGFLGTCTLKR